MPKLNNRIVAYTFPDIFEKKFNSFCRVLQEKHIKENRFLFSPHGRNKYEKLTPGLVASYAVRPGNRVGLFLQPGSPHGAVGLATHKVAGSSPALRLSGNNLG